MHCQLSSMIVMHYQLSSWLSTQWIIVWQQNIDHHGSVETRPFCNSSLGVRYAENGSKRGEKRTVWTIFGAKPHSYFFRGSTSPIKGTCFGGCNRDVLCVKKHRNRTKNSVSSPKTACKPSSRRWIKAISISWFLLVFLQVVIFLRE